MLTVGEMIEQFFDDHPEYDGLVSPDGECGCRRGNLFLCESASDLCRLGHTALVQPGEHRPRVLPGPRPGAPIERAMSHAAMEVLKWPAWKRNALGHWEKKKT